MNRIDFKELDELATKFIIGSKRMSKRKLEILERIEKLKKQEVVLEDRKNRLRNLINILYKRVV